MRKALALLAALVLLIGPILSAACAEEPAAINPSAAKIAPGSAPETPVAPPTGLPLEKDAQPAATVDSLIGIFLGASNEQYQRLAAVVDAEYPTLSEEVVRFLFAQQPDLLTGLMPALGPLMQTDYPEIPRIIGKAIGGNDRLKVRVSQLVTEQYPGFLTDLAKIPHGPGQRAAATRLLTGKYPDLYGNIVDLLCKEFPEVLTQVKEQVIARYPTILGDLARLVARTFPRLTAKTINFVVHRYPALLPQIIAIIYPKPAGDTAPAADAPAPVAPEAAPTSEGTPATCTNPAAPPAGGGEAADRGSTPSGAPAATPAPPTP